MCRVTGFGKSLGHAHFAVEFRAAWEELRRGGRRDDPVVVCGMVYLQRFPLVIVWNDDLRVTAINLNRKKHIDTVAAPESSAPATPNAKSTSSARPRKLARMPSRFLIELANAKLPRRTPLQRLRNF
jgi:hypothetical protein